MKPSLSASDLAGLVEILCDLNARVGEHEYVSNCHGTVEALKKLGLTAEAAVGQTFLFNSGDDTNGAGEPADIMFIGSFVVDDRYGIVIKMNERGVFWRSHRDGSLSND